MDKATCKSCGAAIWWVKTEAGKAMPLDAKPEKRVVEMPHGWRVVDAYVPHWASCPHADQHRQSRAAKD